MTKREFKVGDRVAVYDGGMRRKGTVVEVYKDQLLVLQSNGYELRPHCKQCRRLKPKAKPEVIEFECQWYETLIKGENTLIPAAGNGLPSLRTMLGKRTKVRIEVLP